MQKSAIFTKIFLAKFHFLQFQNWPKINFWSGKKFKKRPEMQFHKKIIALSISGPALWITLAIKMFVIFDWLPAQVAHWGSAITRHFITSIHFDKRFWTLPAFSNHGFGHFIFDVSSLPDFGILFDFFASQRNMRNFFAQSTTFFTTIRILTFENFVFVWCWFHYICKVAEGALL